jgi:hypothetical protein
MVWYWRYTVSSLLFKVVQKRISVFHNSSIIESLMLATDNATVVVYLINQGGTHCHVLFLLCKEIQRLSSALFSSGSQTHSRDLQCLSRSFWLLHNSIVGPSSFEPLALSVASIKLSIIDELWKTEVLTMHFSSPKRWCTILLLLSKRPHHRKLSSR